MSVQKISHQDQKLLSPDPEPKKAEECRLADDKVRLANWKRWGPYLGERQWGTVREDYSYDSESWHYFSHQESRSRAYRWGEDGLLGITDRECRLCFSLALWNGQDPILKERLFGLTNSEGNHGEDVKELYYYLDATPTYSYCRGLYKYPQRAYPYQQLIDQNAQRTLTEPEYEIIDTDIFADNRYFDVYAEYAKNAPDDILIRITIHNRSSQEAPLRVLPTLWFRNTWSWGCTHEGCTSKPIIRQHNNQQLVCEHPTLDKFIFVADSLQNKDRLQFLFTENETNTAKLYNTPEANPYTKDAFHRYVIDGEQSAINPKQVGTKVAVDYNVSIPAGKSVTLRLRLFSAEESCKSPFGKRFDAVFKSRIEEMNVFYQDNCSRKLDPESEKIRHQAYAGLLWNKQFYHYSVKDWLSGDPKTPSPPQNRYHGRNANWQHVFNRDIISMPDKWEYPWFAAWDLAFHMIPFARIDAHFAKQQLILLMREWYMHPNGQIPAYEYNFDDVNPPVHAWACWRIYKMTGERHCRDLSFLAESFHKLLINFTWWVNRKDPDGKNLFSGGFLGLDNIGPFDRSSPLPGNAQLEQADGTAWMAFFCSTMLSMALELAKYRKSYEGVASKFFEHFMSITEAINTLGGTGLWNEDDGFYYDLLNYKTHSQPLKVRSMVGLIPLFAVEVLDRDVVNSLPDFSKRMNWFVKYRNDVAKHISCLESSDDKEHSNQLLLALPSKQRLQKVLQYLLDEQEFLSPYGIRSLSKYHEQHPYVFRSANSTHAVKYTPAESESYLFGGNSNWRGPVWFPVNYLLIESLEKYHHFYGDSLQVECPTGSSNRMNLKQVADEISQRLIRIFLTDKTGNRPVHAHLQLYHDNLDFKDLILFHEYFHGDTGRGAGASHQTGWTGLVAKMIEDQASAKK